MDMTKCKKEVNNLLQEYKSLPKQKDCLPQQRVNTNEGLKYTVLSVITKGIYKHTQT